MDLDTHVHGVTAVDENGSASVYINARQARPRPVRQPLWNKNRSLSNGMAFPCNIVSQETLKYSRKT